MNIKPVLFFLLMVTLLVSACVPAGGSAPAVDLPHAATPAPTATSVPDQIVTMAPGVEATPVAGVPPLDLPGPTFTPPAPTDIPEQVVTLEASPTPWDPTLTCATTFEHREMREPYQRQEDNKPRYTLSNDELAAVFDRMGIASACLPQAFGPVMINADWDSAQTPVASQGVMISLGFEGLYSGAGWSGGYLLYATYDFQAGTEYEIFSKLADVEAMRRGELPTDALSTFQTASGETGFQRIREGIPMGRVPLYMTWVIPSEKSYLAVVLPLGSSKDGNEQAKAKYAAGEFPDGVRQQVALFGAIAQQIKLK